MSKIFITICLHPSWYNNIACLFAETLNIQLTIMKRWDKGQIFTFLGNFPLNFCHIIFCIKQLLLHGGKKCIFPIKKNLHQCGGIFLFVRLLISWINKNKFANSIWFEKACHISFLYCWCHWNMNWHRAWWWILSERPHP